MRSKEIVGKREKDQKGGVRGEEKRMEGREREVGRWGKAGKRKERERERRAEEKGSIREK